MLLDRLTLLSPREREQLLVEWNATDRTYASDVCVHELFDAQVVQRPDAVAIVYEDAQLSYGELDARANRLAHYLRTLGVGPDRRVALCLERSVELVVSILAVLKAGGAYVPLDPSYPSERLQYMLDDSAPVAVLTHGAIDPSVRALLDQCGVPTIDLDDAAAWAGQPSSAPKRADLCPSHAAYVIYTSGSTGRPKGVIVEHCQLSAKLQNARERFAVGAHDVLPNLASYAFDISLLEILVPLISGGSTLLIGTAEVKDVERLIERTSSATIFHAVPSLMAAWLNVLRSANDVYGALRAILVGGEAVPDRLLRTLVARFPNAEIVELYGPTEATIISTAFAVRDASLPAVPYCIGFPLANTRTYILDAYGDPVPIGVTGELYVGGAQVARGYLNRAELTAERFVPDPFGGAGARLYRTGDLARYRNDGTLEFLGRGDFQVKIRGFRIELGEIEGRLREHPDVREAVVVAREDTPGDKRLVAYYTGAEGAEFGASELRAHLQAVLPEYMVPAAYVALEQLPLLPNGKLDRRSLPAPDDAAYTVREYEAPVGEIEEALASIWRELLKLERVGRHDNFFELGGHSLLAVRLLSRIRQALHVDIGLTELFTRPTLSGFAQALRDARHATSMPIVAVERTQRLPLSFAQQRLWFLAQLEGGSEAYHIPFGIRLRGRLDQPALSY
ncbi:MAG: amino acid adenylation domain-containing protein, partial [Candidatus Cybelea sp.]